MRYKQLTDGKHVLYRFFDAEGNLLYIGQTAGIGTRFASHGRKKHWWASVVRIDVEHFPDRESVMAAERAAIESEGPLHNINGRRPSSIPKVVKPATGRVYSERHSRRLRRGK